MLLLDAIRCPDNRRDERDSLLRHFNQHLAKSIYAYYYNTRPADMREVITIVDSQRQEFYREGEYGEYIARNSLIESRESRLYVSYVREEDGTHHWSVPYPPDLLWGDVVPSGAIRVVEALYILQLLAYPRLTLIADFWNGINYVIEDPDPTAPLRNPDFRECNSNMLRAVEENGFPLEEEQRPNMKVVLNNLLFPLYPFDLSPDKNFDQLPPADELDV